MHEVDFHLRFFPSRYELDRFPTGFLRDTHTILITIFPGEPGLAGCPLILLLHLFLNCASLWDRPKLSMSSLTQSHQLFFGRPV